MKFIWTVVIVFALLYGIIFLFKHTLFVPAYIISTIQYDSGSVQQLDDPYLYRAISTQLRGENQYVLKRNKKSILANIQKKFPIVSDLIMTYVARNTLSVEVSFSPPDMMIKNQGLTFGVYEDYIFPIYSGNLIWSQGTGQAGQTILHLPLYASGLTNIDGLFYKQSAKQIKQQIEIIAPAFPTAKMIAYLPGGERTVVIIPDGKRIFINNLSDIASQIKSFELLKKYYPEYNSLREIDLGSLEQDKVIVKR